MAMLELTHYDDIVTVINTFKKNMFALSVVFYYGKYKNGYKEWGFNSFKELCADPDIPVKYAKASKMADVVNFFETKNFTFEDYEDVAYSKLVKIAELASVYLFDNDAIDDWLEDARSLSSADFTEKVKELTGKKSNLDLLEDSGFKRGMYKLVPVEKDDTTVSGLITEQSITIFNKIGCRFTKLNDKYLIEV